MTAALTLPGSIPGLLRRGSPVRFADNLDAKGVVVELRPGSVVVWLNDGEDSEACTEQAADLALDLSDPTGRAHAAWWLAGRFAPAHPFTLVGPHVWALDGRCRNPPCIGFTIGSLAVWASRQPPNNSGPLRGGIVTSLADLDPDDPRTLPDNSRWVDAEALRLVALHLAGRPA